eukprot:11720296-Ditylum_brightwellii.AAC.1
MNALDANLNKDIHNAVHQHISITERLPDIDPRKISMMTKKRKVLQPICTSGIHLIKTNM